MAEYYLFYRLNGYVYYALCVTLGLGFTVSLHFSLLCVGGGLIRIDTQRSSRMDRLRGIYTAGLQWSRWIKIPRPKKPLEVLYSRQKLYRKISYPFFFFFFFFCILSTSQGGHDEPPEFGWVQRRSYFSLKEIINHTVCSPWGRATRSPG